MVAAPWHTLSRTNCEAGVCSRCCLCFTLIALAHFSGPCGQVQQMLIPLQHAGILPNCVFWSLSGRRAGEIMSQEQPSACEAWQLQQIPQLPCHSSEAVLDPLSESLVELSTRCPPDNLFITTLCTALLFLASLAFPPYMFVRTIYQMLVSKSLSHQLPLWKCSPEQS